MNACHVNYGEPFSSFVALLTDQARRLPNRRVLGFLTDGETSEAWRTFAQLDEEARAIAAALQRRGCAGRAALLLYGPGLEFVAGLLGCFYAGVVAVPVSLPRPRRSFGRLEAIAVDSGADLALTTRALLPSLRQRAVEHARLDEAEWLTTDDIDRKQGGDWQPVSPSPESIACVQYTSGSAAEPKGVVLTHGNLLFNSRLICEAFGHGPESVGLVWLPHYHDMGLIGGVLQPLYAAFPMMLMSPVHAVQQPLRWLEGISRLRATTSGGPNFIYELCIRRIDPEQCPPLDLSSWRIAFNGAEPIRPETLDRFAEKFAPWGFRREAFFPCYGLAEATLFVSGGPRMSAPDIQRICKTALEGHRVAPAETSTEDAVRVVACGNPAPMQHVAIVDPETLTLCPQDQVGEIWVSGPSVARGYWNRPEETAETFEARVLNNGDLPYLRTGDLGFLQEGQLYVTGRLKDLMIIDGRNHYPQDVELTVENSHAALVVHGGAAFTVDDLGERLVVVHEVERNGRGMDAEEVLAAIRRSVSEEHELSVQAVVLVKLGGVPRTTSGKIRRRRCRELYLEGQLPVVAQWQQEKAAKQADGCRAATEARSNGRSARESAESIQQWLVRRVAGRVQCAPEQIDIRQPFAWYGLQSRDAVELSGELEDWLHRRLSPTLVYDCPTIEALARCLAGDAVSCGVREATSSEAGGGGFSTEPIAIIGLGCRLPGAPNPEAFWRLLIAGVDAIGEVPQNRWDREAADQLLRAGANGNGNGYASVRWGGWLPEIDQFDPQFFGISPREAACMDPQQRILMEVAWEALEDAGLPAEKLRGSSTGVFVGISTNDYRHQFLSRTSELDPYWSTGNAGSIAANRLSYFLDLRGPSMAVDTACSSSLVAVHLATGSLRSGECDIALAGGVSVILSPDISFSFAKGGGLASDGRCKAFDSRADGIVRSEGSGVVVLKRLSQAIADGDRIYAVIRGSAVNQDGRSNGITAPNQAAQEAVLRSAWRSAGISPGEAQYIETHGAGTLLGDVIEANALRAVLAPGRHAERRCAIGSVKTNIGHCEAAAGISGLIKVALSIHHGKIPPNLHFDQPNPHIPFDGGPMAVSTETADWHGRRLAGVSAFGFGGTNAHIVLESAPVRSQEPDPSRPGAESVHLLPLSAASRPALEALAQQWDGFVALLEVGGSASLADLRQAAATRRSHLDHRATLRFRTVAELREQLGALGSGQPHLAVSVGKRVCDRRPKLAFIFSGQGGQWHGMHEALCHRFPAFLAKLQECDALVREQAGWSVLAELDAEPGRSRVDSGSIEIVQTSLFAFQVALAEAWRAWGIEPDAVAGHSMGEVAAACVAGGLALPEAVRVILHRSRLLQQAMEEIGSAGGMAALRISAEEAGQLIEPYRDRVWIAVHNSPKYTVLSGDRAALEDLVEKLRKRKIGGRLMNVPGAAHTPLLESTGAKLEAILHGLQPQSETVPFYSTLTGRRHATCELHARYWGGSVCQAVQFAPTIDQLYADGCSLFIELGPHPLLAAAIVQCAEQRGHQASALASLRRDDRDLDAMLESLGALYTRGIDVDWRRVDPQRRRWISLPTYPWQHQRCWIEPPKGGRNGNGALPTFRADARQPNAPVAPASDAASEGSDAIAPAVLPCADGNIAEALRLAPSENRRALLQNYLRRQIAQTLGTDPDRIDVHQSLTTLGIDSLMAIETRNRVEAELGLEVQLVQFLEGPTVARLADALLPQLDRCASSPGCERKGFAERNEFSERNEFHFTGGGADRADSKDSPVEVADEEAQRLLERVDQLSDEEIDALMHRMLAE